MPRSQIKVDIPDEWMENLKHGRCWCGKDHTEFDKGQKFYCSEAHAKEYSKRITYWSIFKDEFLSENGSICSKCGMSKEKMEIENENNKRLHYLKVAENHPEAVIMGRAIKIKELQEEFERIMDDAYMAEHLPHEVREEFSISWHDSQFNKKWFQIEVDHKTAVALGGDMWDKENLQALCSDCHKQKTKEDMKKIAEKRKNDR